MKYVTMQESYNIEGSMFRQQVTETPDTRTPDKVAAILSVFGK